MGFGKKTDPKILDKYKKRIEERRKEIMSFGPTIMRIKQGANYVRILPRHENMEIWFIEAPTHFIPFIGSDGKKATAGFPCSKDHRDQEDSLCDACMESSRFMASEDKDEQEYGKEIKAQLKYTAQAILLTPAYDEDGTMETEDDDVTVKMPKCWGRVDRDEKSKCRQCRWFDSCDMGIVPLPMGSTVFNPIFDTWKKSEKRGQDLFDLVNGHTWCITRTGPGGKHGTKYTATCDLQSTSLPDHVVKIAEENAIDLVKWHEENKLSPEKIQAILRGEMGDPASSAKQDSSDGDDIPECVGEFVKNGKSCKEAQNCSFADVCEKVYMEKSDEQEEKTPEPPRGKKSGKAAKPNCFGKYDEDSKKCDRCDYSSDCSESSGEKDENPPCFGKYDEDSKKCDRCEVAKDCKPEKKHAKTDNETLRERLDRLE